MALKRDCWFTDYQEIPGVCDGKRKLADRIPGFQVSDFENRTVLDLGCNVGQMSLYAVEQGAQRVLGVEYDKNAFQTARQIRSEKQLPSEVVQYKLDDLENPLFWRHIDRHDTVLLLSLIDTKELTHPLGILSRACMKCKNVLYFEGHRKQPLIKYVRYLLDHTDFTQIEHRGRYKGRDLFRCTRDVLDSEGFHKTLHCVCRRYNKIAVVGNQLVGKTTLREHISEPEFAVFDDYDNCEEINACRRVILFDYRAGAYANDWDVMFNVLQPPNKFELRRKRSNHLRSPDIGEQTELKSLYSVMAKPDGYEIGA